MQREGDKVNMAKFFQCFYSFKYLKIKRWRVGTHDYFQLSPCGDRYF